MVFSRIPVCFSRLSASQRIVIVVVAAVAAVFSCSCPFFNLVTIAAFDCLFVVVYVIGKGE